MTQPDVELMCKELAVAEGALLQVDSPIMAGVVKDAAALIRSQAAQIDARDSAIADAIKTIEALKRHVEEQAAQIAELTARLKGE